MKFINAFRKLFKKSNLNSYLQVVGIIFFLMMLCSYGFVREQQETVFFVSPTGKDNNPGTREQPLKTLETARDAARSQKAAASRIVILPGEYFISKTFELDTRDNGLTIESDQSGSVIITGGSLVTGWYKDGDKFWCADLPGVKEGTRDFRTLIVNDRMAEKSQYPDTGTFLHKQVFEPKWFDIAWARRPTHEELTTMAYDPKDIPDDLDVNNAEVRVYHMWDESLVRVARNDKQRHALIFSSPCINPPGGFGIMKYVIFNTREGMTRPGQWYLDRTAGRVVYWPLTGENMENAKVIAPIIEQIFNISGTPEKKIERITLRELSFNVTNIPLKPATFGAIAFNGAIQIQNANNCILEKLDVFNVSGLGVSAQQMTNCQLINCDIHHTGAAGVIFGGSDSYFSGNKIHDMGMIYPGAVGLSSYGENLHIYRNEIYNIPYSGMIVGGNDNLVEENHIYRVMLKMHDGGAIYCGTGNRIIYRGNFAHDIVASGKGYGVNGFYFDSNTRDCIMERNVSLKIPRPIHLDYTTNATVNGNIFITDDNMVLSFQQSANCIFRDNTIIAPGRISIVQPNAVKVWEDNLIYRNGRVIDGVLQDFTIDTAMPPYPIPGRKKYPIPVNKISKAPIMDGDIEYNELPGEFYQLDRENSRLPASGWYPRIKFGYDDKYLYLGVNIVMRDPGLIQKGSIWGKNDGVEFSIVGNTPKGKPETFVMRVYADGTVQSISDAGAPAELAKRLANELRVVTKDQKPTRGGGWSCEWAVPFKVLGLKPIPELKVAFNLCAFVNEYDNWHYWEGTQEEGWNMDQAGVFQLK